MLGRGLQSCWRSVFGCRESSRRFSVSNILVIMHKMTAKNWRICATINDSRKARFSPRWTLWLKSRRREVCVRLKCRCYVRKQLSEKIAGNYWHPTLSNRNGEPHNNRKGLVQNWRSYKWIGRKIFKKSNRRQTAKQILGSAPLIWIEVWNNKRYPAELPVCTGKKEVCLAWTLRSGAFTNGLPLPWALF